MKLPKSIKSFLWFIAIVVLLFVTGWGFLLYETNVVYPRNLAQAKQTIERLGFEISTIQNRTGKLPQSQAGLENYLNHKMPDFPWGEKIKYERVNTNRSKLEANSPYPFWDMIEYDSASLSNGVSVVSF